jgi:hypothetical protein
MKTRRQPGDTVYVTGGCNDARRLIDSFERWFDLIDSDCWRLVEEDLIILSTIRKLGTCLNIRKEDIEKAIESLEQLAIERQINVA